MAECEVNYLPTADRHHNLRQGDISQHTQLIQMNYVPKHFWDHADSEYVEVESIREQSSSLTNIQALNFIY